MTIESKPTPKPKRKYTWKIDDATRQALVAVRVRQLQEGVAKWRQQASRHEDRVTVTLDEYRALAKVMSEERLLSLRLLVKD